MHRDYADASFSLVHQDGIARDQNFGTATIVRVFNEDFRREHLLWDDNDGFNPILLLGAENIEKRRLLNAKQHALNAASEASNIAAAEGRRLKKVISDAESECANQMVKELPVGRLDRRHVAQITAAWKTSIPDPLDASAFKAEKAKVSAEQKDLLPPLQANTSSIDELWNVAVAVLGEQIGSSATISRLVEHPDIGKWVEVGLGLHHDSARCEFCQGELPTERVAALNGHFSRAFAELKERIAKTVALLEKRMMTSAGEAYKRIQFYGDYHGEFADATEQLSSARDNFNAGIEGLIAKLKQKESNPFDAVGHQDPAPDMQRLVDAVSRFNVLIDGNNARTREFKRAEEGAIERLKTHYASSAMHKIDLIRLLADILTEAARGLDADELAQALQSEVLTLQAELSEATKGAEAINDALRRFFGKDDIQVRITPDDRFLLVRGDRPARNLSEGERTAIAFCYFVTKLLENGNELANTIVYIDDPISSLDSHHLLHVNAFLKNTFLKRDDAATPVYSCLAKQLFVSTHNYDFFHLVWEWMGAKSLTKHGLSEVYLVERADAAGTIKSRIVECPKSIIQYRSEYLFLYHQLATYVAQPVNDALVIFNLGNMARRFVESYLAFKFLEHSRIDDRLPDLITDPIECETARKFMHFYSHSLSRGGGMKVPDMAEAQRAITAILQGILNHDAVHFASLQKAV